MNFDFQSQDLAAAAQEKCDALLVLVPDGWRAGRSPLDLLVAQAIKDGDLDTKGPKPLSAYRSGQVKADRWVRVGIAGGSAAQVRAAVAAALALVKSPKLKRLVVAFAAPAQEAALRAAAPFKHIIPLPRTPAIAYVSRRSPLLLFTISTFSPSIKLANSIRSSSMVMLPT